MERESTNFFLHEVPKKPPYCQIAKFPSHYKASQKRERDEAKDSLFLLLDSF